MFHALIGTPTSLHELPTAPVVLFSSAELERGMAYSLWLVTWKSSLRSPSRHGCAANFSKPLSSIFTCNTGNRARPEGVPAASAGLPKKARSGRGSARGAGLRSTADCCRYNGKEFTRGASMLLKRDPLKATAPRLSPASLPRHA